MKLVSKRKELSDVTITHVSYVKRGANKKTFFLSKSESQNPDVEFDVRVVKDDNSTKKLLYGIVYEPDSIDAHGDIMNSEEIEKTAHEFTVYYRNIDNEHNLIAGAGQVVESYIAPADMLIGDSEVKKGSWILVTKATDEIWQDYINGDITGYSMFGIARVAVTKSEPETEIGFVQKFLEKLGIVKSFEETLNETVESMKSSPMFVMSMLEKDFWKNISWENTTEQDLVILQTSLREAADYIDTIKPVVEVIKTEDTQDNATMTSLGTEVDGEIPAEVVEPIVEPVVVIEPVVEEVVPEVVETIEPIEEVEPEPNPEVEALILEKQELLKELEIANAIIEKTNVRSSFASALDPVNIQEKPKPKLF